MCKLPTTLRTSLRRLAKLLLAIAVCSALTLPSPAAEAPTSKIGYNQHIRPILSDNCFACHGPDKNKREADLRLDKRESAIESKAIVPGKPGESELVRRILSQDTDELMPPPEAHKKLTGAQKELLKQWIAQGAEYQPHWAYITPKRPATPTVSNAAWVRNAIDPFILAPLEARKITPMPEADRRTLLRRLSLDLIGMPPTPAEVDAFVGDTRPDAYERQVDRLLASPHFGERMAVCWLDAVRFADTVGFHGDQNQNIFPYRDYVIEAFNKNKSFDQFTIEQLAGDLLPNPTVEQRIATGFNRLNEVTREGGAQPKEYLAKYAADRVRTVSQAFLGSTMGCCECHDHKYDPFTARDFYALSAFFADIQQWGVYADYGYTPNKELRGYGNDHPFPPELIVESPHLQRRRKQLRDKADQIVAAATDVLLQEPAKRAEFEKWQQATRDFLKAHPTGWLTPELVQTAETKAPDSVPKEKKPAAKTVKKGKRPKQAPVTGLDQEDDGSIRMPDKSDSAKLEYVLDAGTIAAVRLEVLPDERFAGRITRSEGDQPPLTLAAALTRAGKSTPLTVFQANADLQDYRFSGGRARPGVQEGWKVASGSLTKPQTAVYLLTTPQATAAGDKLTITLGNNRLANVRISVSPLADLEPVETNQLAETIKQSSDTLLLCRTCVLSSNWSSDVLTKLRAVQRELATCMAGKTPTLITVAVPPVTTRVLPRGNWQDESGAVVEPAVPRFLAQQEAAGKRLTRLDLARWIVADDNPLTSRALVNRMWKQFFGAGISAVVEDLGGQGEWPSHPELLDWLAVEFRESKWDVKHMVRLMVTSNAYRQNSRLRADLLATDPQNRLLSSQNPRRLEAEFVRDNALFIAGLINLEMGGPSVKPYQPPGYYENLQFPDRDYVAEKDERQYRRGIYMHWQRTFLHPMLANFDAPPRENSACTRIVSNTPQQALTLLNDPEFVEAARVLAQRVLSKPGDTSARLEQVYQLSLCRSPKPCEAQSLANFLRSQQEYFSQHPQDAEKLIKFGLAPAPAEIPAAELASWTSVCRVVLNLHETITRY